MVVVITEKVVDIKNLYQDKQTQLFNILLYEYFIQRLNELNNLLYDMDLDDEYLSPDETFRKGVEYSWTLWDTKRLMSNLSLLEEKTISIPEVKKHLLNSFIFRNIYNKFICSVICEMHRESFTNEEIILFLERIMEKELEEDFMDANAIDIGFNYPIVYPHETLDKKEIIPISIGFIYINISDIIRKLNYNIGSDETRRAFTNNLFSLIDNSEKTDEYEYFIAKELMNIVNKSSENNKNNPRLTLELPIKKVKNYKSSK